MFSSLLVSIMNSLVITHDSNLFVWRLQAVQRVFLSCAYTTLDYAQTGLIAAVFFFKVCPTIYYQRESRIF